MNASDKSTTSLISSNDDALMPMSYNEPTPQHEQGEKSHSQSDHGRRSSTSLSLLFRLIPDSIRRTFSDQSNQLSKLPTGYSVKDIYGDADDNSINLRRIATKLTILTTLGKRALAVGTERDHDDMEAQTGRYSESKDQVLDIDDDVPDMPVPTKDFGGEFSAIDPELVTWDGEDDPAYPRNWPNSKRWFQTFITATYTLMSPMSLSVCLPAMDNIAESLNMSTDQFLKSFSVSVMVLAWALGPLIIAPLSESNRIGRRPVLNISIWINAIFNLACGFAKTPAQLCVFRFLGGLGGCAALNVGAGTLADIWRDHERNKAMGFYSINPTLGPVIAPIISSFVLTGTNWHWCFWVLAIINFVVAALGTLLFEETYSPRLLLIKAARLRKETGNEHLHTIFEIADGETLWGKMYVTVTRPLSFIVGHPMVFGLGSFMAFVYGFMYLMITTFPLVFRDSYGFSVNISGLMYLSMGIGYVLGTIFWVIMIDRVNKKLVEKNNGVVKPEYRLYCLVAAGIGAPAGLVIYGWGARYKVMWLLPCVGAGVFSFFMTCVFQCIQTYLIQMNNRFAASAVAASAVFRSFFGFGFPLFAPYLYARLGYGWGNTLCALLMWALGVPFPLFCLRYGERLRNWANRKFDARQAVRDARNLERLRQMNEKTNVIEKD